MRASGGFTSSLRAKRSLRATVRRVIGAYAEKKMTIGQRINEQLYHAVGSSNIGTYWTTVITNLLSTPVGTGQFQRVGDSIQAQKLDFKFWLSNKGDRPNVMYRILVVKGEEGDMASGTNLGMAGASANTMLTFINTDKYTVLYDRVINSAAGFKANQTEILGVKQPGELDRREQALYHSFTVPINKKITYKTDAGAVPTGNNYLNCYVIPYDAYGTSLTDNIASMAFNVKFTFTDI